MQAVKPSAPWNRLDEQAPAHVGKLVANEVGVATAEVIAMNDVVVVLAVVCLASNAESAGDAIDNSATSHREIVSRAIVGYTTQDLGGSHIL